MTDGDDRQIAILNVMTVCASPLLHGRRGTGVGNLGLQGELGLDGLRCLSHHYLMLLVQHIEFFETTVKFKDNEDQGKDPDHHYGAAYIDG